MKRNGAKRYSILLLAFMGLFLGGTTSAYAQAGAVMAWGYNGGGQLGGDLYTDSSIPKQVAGLSKVVQVASGDTHTLALKWDGTVWAWGQNGAGQLGDGTNTDKYTPIQVSGLTGIVQVTAGSYASLAVKSDGTIWAWGNNGYGQLGDGTTTDRNIPVQVSGLTDVVQASGGKDFSIALKSDGTVWVWGANDWGQLGDGTTTNRTTPVVVFGAAIQVSAGYYHSLALKQDGTVWAWGLNSAGQLGDGTTTNRKSPVQVSGLTSVTQAVVGGFHSLALKQDGTVWAWGLNQFGEVGDGTTTNRSYPVQIPNLMGIVQVSGGYVHCLALQSDGTAWAWGYNSSGQLGDGTTTDRHTPITTIGISGTTQIASGSLSMTSYSLYPIPQSRNRSTKVSLYSQVSYYGQAVTITPKLLALDTGSPILHEVLVCSIDGVAVGNAETDVKGNASITLPPDIAVGKHTLSVNFTGDSPFYVASEKTTTLSVVKTATLLKMGNVTKRYGQTATFTAVIRRATDSARLAGKTISLTLDGDSIGQATTDANGAVAFTYLVDEQLQAGAHDIEAAFAGDSSYKASVIDVFLSVDPADTRITVNSVAGAYGQTKSLVAILKRNTDNRVVSGRAITFSVDGVSVGEATTDLTGKATFPYLFDEPLTAGTHTLAATFTGDDGYNPSTKSASVTASQAATKISQSSVTGKIGATVQLVAKLKRSTDNKYLSARTVRFSVNGSEVGTAQTDSTGTAAYSYTIPSSLAAGKYTLKAAFDGDSFYLGSAYSGAALTVK